MSRLQTRAGAGRRPAGIALILTLVVVMLLTAYMTEFFFSTGLELRSMRTFKDAAQARSLAKLAFKAVQVGMLADELDFFANYGNLEKVLAASAIPWQDGLLVELKIIPQDGLFNLNELDPRDNTDPDRVRWNLFLNTLADVEAPSELPGLPPEPVAEGVLGDIYAALVDWIDGGGNASYQGASGSVGAEQATYLSSEPEVRIKNGPLDRLSEIRLVRGVGDSRITWEQWQDRFAVLPKSSKSEPYPEKLNVNVATREQIQAFLEQREFEDVNQLGPEWKTLQTSINVYADSAADIAEVLVPEFSSEKREAYNKTSLEQRLPKNVNSRIATNLFSFANENYRIRITTSFNDVDARLEALINIPRNAARVGTSVRVIHLTLD